MSEHSSGSTAAGRKNMDQHTRDASPDGTVAQRGQIPDHAPQLPGTTAAPTLFENPGLPPHVHRLSDTDPKAAKRAERQVAAMFTLSILGTLVFLVSYFAIDKTTSVYIPLLGTVLLQHLLLGLGMGFGIFFIGIGAAHWACSDCRSCSPCVTSARSQATRWTAGRARGRRAPGWSPTGSTRRSRRTTSRSARSTTSCRRASRSPSTH